jgi:hypothetical protein
MKRTSLIVWVACFIVLVGVVLFFLRSTETNEQVTDIKSSNWDVKYGFDSKDPLGLYYFNSLLKLHSPKSNLLNIESEKYLDSACSKHQPDLYILIGDTVTLEAAQGKKLLSEVEKSGATLFISSEKTYNWLLDLMLSDHEMPYFYASQTPLFTQTPRWQQKLESRTLNVYHLFQADTLFGTCYGFRDPKKILSPITTLHNLTTEGECRYGKGKIILSAVPWTFVNYQFLNPEGLNHAEYLISHFPKTKSIYFVSFANLQWSPYFPRENDQSAAKHSPLRLINENPPLKNAMWAALVGLLLFVVFLGKRTRPIVPMKEKSINVTRNYVTTLSSIYRSHESPDVAFALLKQNFYHTLQRWYYFDLSKMDTETQIDYLLSKSNVNRIRIEKLVHELNHYDFEVEMPFVYQTADSCHAFLSEAGIIQTQHNPLQFPFTIRRKLWITSLFFFIAIFALVIGFYLSSKSIEIGPFLMALGGITLGVALLRLNMPYIIISPNKIEFLSLIGTAQEIKLTYLAEEDLLQLKTKNKTFTKSKIDIQNQDWDELIMYLNKNKTKS